MKKILTYIFVTLGVIFTIQLVALAYLWIADPFHIKPLLIYVKGFQSYNQAAQNINSATAQPTSGSTAVKLSDEQVQLLQKANIDIKDLNSKLTPEFAICATQILGQQRVVEITQGAAPTDQEIAKIIPCIK